MAESTIERTAEIRVDRSIDCRGLLCPMPIVKTGIELRSLAPGQVLKVVTTDRGAIADMPAFVEDTGNSLLEWHQDGRDLVFYIRKEAQSE
ncbi:MAG TPA: sulfurtransferase TusA family protein [Candidatus Dormibacteraeota bacterium]|nr:sulfurtransferase TusA family protein [Candidatus Dormibacteraeota bacterium]